MKRYYFRPRRLPPYVNLVKPFDGAVWTLLVVCLAAAAAAHAAVDAARRDGPRLGPGRAALAMYRIFIAEGKY